MFRLRLGVAALALAASGAFAQNTGQPGAEQGAPQNAEQRGGPPGSERSGDGRDQRGDQRDKAERTDEAPPRAADLRGLRDAGRDAQVVADILKNQDSREARNPSQPAADRPGPPARSGAPSETGLRDLFSREGTERVLERMVAGPLDRSVRMLVRCPPGLAKTGGCEAPGRAQSNAGQRDSLPGRALSPLLFGLTGFDAGRYLYRDGYLMQLADGDGIAGYIPLLGGALASGNIWPGSYGSANVPAYLVDFYNLGQPGSYRYADNTLYRVDPQSAAIQSVAALLTDEEVTIGEPMPAGYDVYNVPYPFRDRYADSAEAAYRYVDGYVYRLDPETRLVTAAFDLLT
ncbi:hypothetical protein [Qipengyuania sp. SM2507]